MLPSVSCNIPRKAPRDRSIPDEYVHFVQKDKINDFDSLDQFFKYFFKDFFSRRIIYRGLAEKFSQSLR